MRSPGLPPAWPGDKRFRPAVAAPQRIAAGKERGNNNLFAAFSSEKENSSFSEEKEAKRLLFSAA
jgi:hypothetical protein